MPKEMYWMESAAADVERRPAAGMPSRPLRFRLFLLAASGLAPLALVLLLACVYVAQERQTETLRSALELSRAMATAVDAELRGTVGSLENIEAATQLQGLGSERLAGKEFAPLALRVTDRQGWRTLTVANAAGEVMMRAGDAAPARRAPIDPASMLQVSNTRSATVGPVAADATGREAFAVRIPIVQGHQLRYVLSAVLPTDRIVNVLARQHLAPTWVVGVYDQNGSRVARSKPTAALRYSPSLQALINAQGADGMGRTRTIGGVESLTGFARLHAAQWVVAVGIPASEANSDLYRLLLALGAGTAASLGLLALLAWRMAGRISEPIDVLKQAAIALGAGRQVELPVMGVEELDEVGQALRRAAIDRDEANAHRDKVEAEREQLLVRIEEALRLAEQANRNKDEFLALLGHELRNPLAPIMNAVHLLELKADPNTLQERRVMQRQLNYVTRLVDDLLDASRITSNRFVIKLRPLRPVPVLEQTVEAISPSLGPRRLNLSIAEETRALWVRGDEARLVQVFNNLLGNAIKFTAPSGVIDVLVSKREGAIEFAIRDSGAGMAPADLKRAFDLFYQAPNAVRGVSAGLGLGLAIVKSLVEMHLGSVQAHSEGLGQGTTITVRLPVIEAPAEVPTTPRARAATGSTRVLVVDDNEDAADTLASLLGSAGFVVQAAYSPQSAIEVTQTFRPKIAILDIGLPGMNGYDLAARLRSLDEPFTGRVIALTGYGQAKDIQRAMDAGFDAHLTKPVEPESLLQLLSKFATEQA
jgi:signal transduction histidine kinase/ActR/RegA family two-component response regulator